MTQLKTIKIAFIGGGNMAGALIGGLLQKGAVAKNICAADPYEPTRKKLVDEFKIGVGASIAEIASQITKADIVVLAVKPQQLKEACTELAPVLQSGTHAPVCLSVAAGIMTGDIARWLSHKKIIRAMPNTPALIGQGMTGLFATPTTNDEEQRLAQTICDAVGTTIWVKDESLMNAVTAVSGSGPAYVFAFLESIETAAVSLGIDATTARTLAIQTVLGSANLAAQSNDAPGTLREKVTSKGGTTFAALQVLENNQWSKIIAKAIHAADARGAEMGEEFGQS
jgi:pyrroline-5-carboxylate reductase